MGVIEMEENNLEKKEAEKDSENREVDNSEKEVGVKPVEEEQEDKEEKKIEGVKKEEPKVVPKSKDGEGSFMPVILVMILALAIAGFWEKIPAIKSAVTYVLDPTAGWLINWNLNWGMLIIVLFITIITTIVQKYATDQDTLRELKKEQKDIQKQMKEFKDHPDKMMELQKKQFAMMPKQMKLSMRGAVYTIIPFALFFRWFHSFFDSIGDPRLFLGLNWFWFYFLSAIIIGSILRKKFDVV